MAEPAGAGDARHQPLRAGDRRVDHQGAGAGLPRPRHRRAGAVASASRSRASNPRTRRPFIWHMFHARPGGGAIVGRRRLGDRGRGPGRRRHQVRQRRGRRGALPADFEHHEFRPDSAGDGMHRGGVGAVLRLRVDDRGAGGGQHGRRRRAPCALRPARAAATACPIATGSARGAARPARSRPRRSASSSAPATCSSSSLPAAAATAPPGVARLRRASVTPSTV